MLSFAFVVVYFSSLACSSGDSHLFLFIVFGLKRPCVIVVDVPLGMCRGPCVDTPEAVSSDRSPLCYKSLFFFFCQIQRESTPHTICTVKHWKAWFNLFYFFSSILLFFVVGGYCLGTVYKWITLISQCPCPPSAHVARCTEKKRREP